MAISRWEPFRELTTLREAMDRLMEEAFYRPGFLIAEAETARIPIDMFETPSEVIVRAPVPGVRPEDIDVSITANTLTIRGERKPPEVKEENFFVHEIRPRRFHRELMLPVPIQADKAEATFENGVLSLRLPKAEEVKAKKIKVQAKAELPSGGRPVKV